MKKKGLAGGLLLALLLSACSKGVDVPGTTPRDRAERDERGEAAEDSRDEEPAEAAEDSRDEEPAGAAEDGSAQQEEAPGEDAGEREDADDVSSGDDGTSGEARIFGTYVDTIHCGYLFQSNQPKPWIMYHVSTDEEILYAEVFLDMCRPLGADDDDPDEWILADAFQDMMAKYPSSQYDYLFYYTEYSQGGYSHHADYLVCNNGEISFHCDSVTSPQGNYSTDMMDGEIDMAAVPKKYFKGKHFSNLYQVESIWLGNEDDPVDPGYIVSFHSGGSEHTEETYVYETENGYHYINVESTTESWGSPRWRHRIISYGDLETKEEVIEHAKHHGASQHIRFPGDNTPHPIEDFLNI